MSRALRIAIVATFAGAAAIATAVLVFAGGSNPEQEICRGPLDDGPPLPGGESMTPAEAEAVFRPPVFRPQTSVASDETIGNLWLQPEHPREVFIEYESGMAVIVERWKRPTWEYARDQIADGSPGELIKIRGIDAFVIAPDPPCFGGNTVFNLHGAEVAIIGNVDLPFATVRQAAESIIATAPTVLADDAIAGRD